jgi:hypothetical protein
VDEAERSELNARTGVPIYDREGKPIGLGDWVAMREDHDHAIVAADYPVEGVRVSTAWLGLDHSFLVGPPVIFETMVFDERRARKVTFGGCELLARPTWDEWSQRYSTEDEARAGHARICDAIAQGKSRGTTGENQGSQGDSGGAARSHGPTETQ